MDLDTALNDKPAEGASAVEILRADHVVIRKLFAEYDDAADALHVRRVTLQSLCMQLELHDDLERSVFYPALRHLERIAVDGAVRDHDEITALVLDLRERSECDGECDAKVAQLKSVFERHARKEEAEVFSLVQSSGDAEWLRELGIEMVQEKEKITRSTEEFEGPAT